MSQVDSGPKPDAGDAGEWCPKDGERVLMPGGIEATVDDGAPPRGTVVMVRIDDGARYLCERSELRPIGPEVPPDRSEADLKGRRNQITFLARELFRSAGELRDGVGDLVPADVAADPSPLDGVAARLAETTSALAKLRATCGPAEPPIDPSMPRRFRWPYADGSGEWNYGCYWPETRSSAWWWNANDGRVGYKLPKMLGLEWIDPAPETAER